jgi:hypothetical protein
VTAVAFELPAEAKAWRDKVRAFVEEELIPLEAEAEMNGGKIAPALRKAHETAAI